MKKTSTCKQFSQALFPLSRCRSSGTALFHLSGRCKALLQSWCLRGLEPEDNFRDGPKPPIWSPLTFAEFRVTFSFLSQFRAFSQSGSLEAAILLKTQKPEFTSLHTFVCSKWSKRGWLLIAEESVLSWPGTYSWLEEPCCLCSCFLGAPMIRINTSWIIANICLTVFIENIRNRNRISNSISFRKHWIQPIAFNDAKTDLIGNK